MDKKWAAILTSLTVFPGCGHFIIGQKTRGLIWLLSTIITLCLMIYSFESALIHQIKTFEGNQISFFLAFSSAWGEQKDTLIRFFGFLGLIWILSLGDLLLIFRKK